MTNADVLTTILHEVTGRPMREVVQVVNVARLMDDDGNGTRLDTELSDADAAALLAQLRTEKAGILNWLIAGRQRVIYGRQSTGCVDGRE